MDNINKFEDFLDRMQGLLDKAKKQGHIIVRVEDLENTFPELKESEDEKIRKELIEHCKNQAKPYIDTGNECPQIQSWIAWLEKQGEHKSFDYENTTIVPKDFAPKVKPKFKVGDWVVFNNRHISVYQVEKIENYEYTLRHFLGGSMLLSFSHEDMIRAWTIQDAKGGDVLVHNGITFIFKGIEDGIVKGLCSELSDSILNFGEPEHDKDYYPATKEQRYFLFQKMKEAGYEWDVEKKELKKIENRPMLSDFFNAEYERGKADALKSVEWSEEDEKNLVQCIEAIDVYYEWDSMIDWLKSLRSRSRWKPSEEQMRALHDMNLTGNISYAGQGQVLIELYNDLKKL